MRWANEIFFPLLISLVIAGLGWWGIRSSQPLLRSLAWMALGIGVLLTVTSLFFFRDPDRHSAAGPEVILSPADGRVVAVEEIQENRFINGPAKRVAIFMHVGNVHVQRMPAPATLIWTKHYPGKFLPAYEKRAAVENEQQFYAFDHEGRKFAVVQIAGLIARRVRCWIEPGKFYGRGEKIGMIMYGSEVDVYLPPAVSLSVKPGDIVTAGLTQLGSWQ